MNSAKRIFPRLKATSEDNQVLFLTRLIAAIIIPILTIAFLMLYLLPKQSGILFAWPIKPSMTAMMLGAAYLGGAYYFTRVFLAKKWSRVKLGFLPVTAFASFLGIATILHWDKFTAGHPSFIMWAFLYIVLPFVLPVIWWLNRDADPQTLDTHDSYLPKNIERFFLAIGILLTFVSLILLIVPAVMISIWPWTISALTGRVLGAMFVLPGLVGIGIAQNKRWRSAQIILQSQIFSMGLILLAIVISRTDFDWAQLGAWVFALSFTLLFIALIAIYIMMTKRTN